jgi:hypothetical protein
MQRRNAVKREKRKFLVTVQRLAVQEVEVEVEATSWMEADSKALENAGSVDFTGTEKDAEYRVASRRLKS